MKTNYFLLSVCLLLVSILNINTASAQFRFGVRGGVDVSSSKINSNILNTSNRLGFQIGPTAEFIVPMSGFGADIAVLYGHKEYKLKDKTSDSSLSDYNYISVPVNIKQRISLGVIGIFFTGGVYGNVKVGDEGENNIGGVIDAYKHKNFIFGLGAGAGVNVFRHLDVGLYFRGDLTNNYSYEYMDAETFQNKKNQYWTVGVNYFF